MTEWTAADLAQNKEIEALKRRVTDLEGVVQNYQLRTDAAETAHHHAEERLKSLEDRLEELSPVSKLVEHIDRLVDGLKPSKKGAKSDV